MNSFYTKKELYTLGLKKIGNNVRIDDFCILSGSIELGSFIHIGAYCALYAINHIQMKDFTGLSARCTLYTAMDNFNGDFLISPLTKKEHNNLIGGSIIIEKYSQIGSGTVVFPNVVINEGTAIGALSVVRQTTLPWSIYAGIPAIKIKNRKNGLLNFINDY